MVIQASTEAEVIAAVSQAAAEHTTLEIIGQGSRRALGHPGPADAVLDVSAMTGVTIYEPSELVLTARAGTALADIEAIVAAEGQHLAFEPPDFGPLWSQAAGRGTVGGMVSVGLGGPRRWQAGGPRDHLLGFRAVNGFGQAFAAGGRVVKNVTGFDLPKLVCGAYGTLGVLTEVTLKVLPAPRAVRTLSLPGLGVDEGLALLRRAAAGAIPVTGAAYLPKAMAPRFDLGASAALLRLEGEAAVIEAQITALQTLLGLGQTLGDQASRALWCQIAGAEAFAGSGLPVWRISTPPASATRLAASLAPRDLYFDWVGGLVWIEGEATEETFRDLDGHATLVRGGPDANFTRSPNPGVAALTARVKAQFDPHGVFNPGRMGPP